MTLDYNGPETSQVLKYLPRGVNNFETDISTVLLPYPDDKNKKYKKESEKTLKNIFEGPYYPDHVLLFIYFNLPPEKKANIAIIETSKGPISANFLENLFGKGYKPDYISTMINDIRDRLKRYKR